MKTRTLYHRAYRLETTDPEGGLQHVTVSVVDGIRLDYMNRFAVLLSRPGPHGWQDLFVIRVSRDRDILIEFATELAKHIADKKGDVPACFGGVLVDEPFDGEVR